MEGKESRGEREKERETEMKEDLEGRERGRKRRRKATCWGWANGLRSWLFIFGKEYSACVCLGMGAVVVLSKDNTFRRESH